jgi:glucose-1-phosphate adenylyltransferase
MPLPEVLVDLDRTTGGMLTLPPRQGSDRGRWHAGTADTLWRNAELIRERGAELLVVLSADAVHKLDYREASRRVAVATATSTVCCSPP